jgi:hypothetical protein
VSDTTYALIADAFERTMSAKRIVNASWRSAGSGHGGARLPAQPNAISR